MIFKRPIHRFLNTQSGRHLINILSPFSSHCHVACSGYRLSGGIICSTACPANKRIICFCKPITLQSKARISHITIIIIPISGLACGTSTRMAITIV